MDSVDVVRRHDGTRTTRLGTNKVESTGIVCSTHCASGRVVRLHKCRDTTHDRAATRRTHHLQGTHGHALDGTQPPHARTQNPQPAKIGQLNLTVRCSGPLSCKVHAANHGTSPLQTQDAPRTRVSGRVEGGATRWHIWRAGARLAKARLRYQLSRCSLSDSHRM